MTIPEETPYIELYMNSLQQEFRADTEVVSYAEWSQSGTQNSYVLHSKRPTDDLQPWSDNWYENWTGNWSGQWQAQWINNSFNSFNCPTVDLLQDEGKPPPLRKKQSLASLRYREEEFGGIAYDPGLNRVYKVNRPGLRLLLEIINYCKSRTSVDAHFSSQVFSVDEIGPFMKFLEEAGYDV